MAMLAEQYRYVIGGDPDRDTIDLAVLDTATGGVRAHVAETADGPGYDRILAWADAHAPHERVWALEGTGSFAAGFAQTLADAGEAVVEVGAAKRTRGAKNDHIDAVRAARSALAVSSARRPPIRNANATRNECRNDFVRPPLAAPPDRCDNIADVACRSSDVNSSSTASRADGAPKTMAWPSTRSSTASARFARATWPSSENFGPA